MGVLLLVRCTPNVSDSESFQTTHFDANSHIDGELLIVRQARLRDAPMEMPASSKSLRVCERRIAVAFRGHQPGVRSIGSRARGMPLYASMISLLSSRMLMMASQLFASSIATASPHPHS
jgi:hypothetical protein